MPSSALCLRLAAALLAPLALACEGTDERPDSGIPRSTGRGPIPDARPYADADAPKSDASEDAGVSSSTASYAPNEVSILYPLDPDRMLRPSDVGAYGALVPRALVERAGPLSLSGTTDEIYAKLRVVSARLDPCSRLEPSGPCRAQLRLVLQPVLRGPVGFSTEDLALHAIYSLPAEELRALLRGIRALSDPALLAERRLLVHPTLEREGLAGPYATQLRALLLAATGADRLTRLTFMQVLELANTWTFGGLDRQPNGSYSPTAIRGVAQATERVSNNVSTDELRFELTPTVVDADDLSPLFDSARLAGLPAATRRAALGAALRIESPAHHSPETVDCARCHVAAAVRRWTARIYAEDLSQHPDLYRSSAMDLTVPETVPPPLAQRTLRAFGWIEGRPAISPRVANETAAVLEAFGAP